MEIFLIGAWKLWKVRNAVIFDNAHPTVHLWSVKFREQTLLHLVRFTDVTKDSVVSWLSFVTLFLSSLFCKYSL